MPRIDFYLLADDNPTARWNIVFRLADKAYQLGHKIYVHTSSAQETNLLDNLLWTQREDSFLPHAVYGDSQLKDVPILIGHGGDPSDQQDILMNLSQTTPDFFSRFQRVIEVIPAETSWRDMARARYKQYRELGCELATHNV